MTNFEPARSYIRSLLDFPAPVLYWHPYTVNLLEIVFLGLTFVLSSTSLASTFLSNKRLWLGTGVYWKQMKKKKSHKKKRNPQKSRTNIDQEHFKSQQETDSLDAKYEEFKNSFKNSYSRLLSANVIKFLKHQQNSPTYLIYFPLLDFRSQIHVCSFIVDYFFKIILSHICCVKESRSQGRLQNLSSGVVERKEMLMSGYAWMHQFAKVYYLKSTVHCPLVKSNSGSLLMRRFSCLNLAHV